MYAQGSFELLKESWVNVLCQIDGRSLLLMVVEEIQCFQVSIVHGCFTISADMTW